MTELFPFGRRQLAGEFLTLLEHVRGPAQRPRIVASVRDILAAPARHDRVEQTHARLRAYYDAVLVHGDPRVVPLDASWPDAGAIASLLHYTGYIDAAPAAAPSGREEDNGEILVSGGGSAAGLPLFKAALAAARLHPTLRWHILAGHGLPEETLRDLAETAPDNAILERARPDFPALLEGCAVSVSQAGYNTVMDVLRARVRSVLVPFEGGHETEQRIRAEQFSARGLATLLPEDQLSGATLAAAVMAARSRPSPAASAIDRDGLARSVALLLELAARNP